MRIVTWNVNSLKARLPRVEEWIADVQPDVLCMQETKMSNEAFPALTFEAMGYESVHLGQGQWNGVAIASREPITEVEYAFPDMPGFLKGHEGPDAPQEARALGATIVRSARSTQAEKPIATAGNNASLAHFIDPSPCCTRAHNPALIEGRAHESALKRP